MTRRLRRLFFHAILRQEMTYFDKTEHAVSVLTERLSTDPKEIQDYLVFVSYHFASVYNLELYTHPFYMLYFVLFFWFFAFLLFNIQTHLPPHSLLLSSIELTFNYFHVSFFYFY